MQLIEKPEVERGLKAFDGQRAFLHMEVTPGGFVRNVQADIKKSYIEGEGPFRAALRLQGGGWVRVEGLTHYQMDEEGRLLLAGHDERGRLTTALELSSKPFPF
jgi:hypothetical protein